LLRENHDSIGTFSVNSDGDIYYGYKILSSMLDKAQLDFAIRVVVTPADKYADQITAKWGGVTGIEEFGR